MRKGVWERVGGAWGLFQRVAVQSGGMTGVFAPVTGTWRHHGWIFRVLQEPERHLVWPE